MDKADFLQKAVIVNVEKFIPVFNVCSACKVLSPSKIHVFI